MSSRDLDLPLETAQILEPNVHTKTMSKKKSDEIVRTSACVCLDLGKVTTFERGAVALV